jgi:membrane fusion protein
MLPGPRQTLFRAEALHEQRTLWLGRQTLSLGLPAASLSAMSTVLLIATALLVTFGSYARRETLHGVMLPSAGLVQVMAPATGWVETLHVKEGETVSPDTRLYTLNTDHTTKDGSAQQRVLQSLTAERALLLSQIERKTQITEQENAQLLKKMANLSGMIQQMQAGVAQKEEFVRILTKEFENYTRYIKQGIGNLNEKNVQQANWMRNEDELQDLKTRLLRLQGERIDIQAKLENLRLQSANEIDGLRAKVSEVDEQITNAEAKHAIEIVSSSTGQVTAIAVQQGQVVQSGTRLLTVVPADTRLQAELLAPSASIGFIRTGERVLLRYAAFPYQKFGSYWGTVTEVSHATLQPDELKAFVPSIPTVDQSKTFYRVTVEPDSRNVIAYGREQTVEVSMQVDAGVLLDRRPIYEWILEPLYGMNGL